MEKVYKIGILYSFEGDVVNQLYKWLSTLDLGATIITTWVDTTEVDDTLDLLIIPPARVGSVRVKESNFNNFQSNPALEYFIENILDGYILETNVKILTLGSSITYFWRYLGGTVIPYDTLGFNQCVFLKEDFDICTISEHNSLALSDYDESSIRVCAWSTHVTKSVLRKKNFSKELLGAPVAFHTPNWRFAGSASLPWKIVNYPSSINRKEYGHSIGDPMTNQLLKNLLNSDNEGNKDEKETGPIPRMGFEQF